MRKLESTSFAKQPLADGLRRVSGPLAELLNLTDKLNVNRETFAQASATMRRISEPLHRLRDVENTLAMVNKKIGAMVK